MLEFSTTMMLPALSPYPYLTLPTGWAACWTGHSALGPLSSYPVTCSSRRDHCVAAGGDFGGLHAVYGF